MGTRFVVMAVIMSVSLGLAGCAYSTATPSPTATPPPTTMPSPMPVPTAHPTTAPHAGQSIPSLPTSAATRPPVALPGTTPQTPSGTSLFPLPPSLPAQTAAPATDCATVYPLDAVLHIVQEEATIDQAVAAFGPLLGTSGRPPRFRFEDRGCTLWITAGPQRVQAAELEPYFSLADLLASYGTPEAMAQVPAQVSVGVQLPGRDRLALLYPDAGLIALFEGAPDRRADLVPQLRVVPPMDVAGLLRALGGGATLVEGWGLPLR